MKIPYKTKQQLEFSSKEELISLCKKIDVEVDRSVKYKLLSNNTTDLIKEIKQFLEETNLNECSFISQTENYLGVEFPVSLLCYREEFNKEELIWELEYYFEIQKNLYEELKKNFK